MYKKNINEIERHKMCCVIECMKSKAGTIIMENENSQR